MARLVTLSDLESGWRQLSQGEKTICDTLLKRAEAMVNVAFVRAGVDTSSFSEDELEVVKAVVCDMVQNAMVNSRDYTTFSDSDIYAEAGATWETQPIGGWLRITDEQLAQLGISSYIWTIPVKDITDED